MALLALSSYFLKDYDTKRTIATSGRMDRQQRHSIRVQGRSDGTGKIKQVKLKLDTKGKKVGDSEW